VVIRFLHTKSYFDMLCVCSVFVKQSYGAHFCHQDKVVVQCKNIITYSFC